MRPLSATRMDEIAEAAKPNIVVERDGEAKVTRLLSCGLLAGTFQAEPLAGEQSANRL